MAEPVVRTKRCCRCKTVKPVTEFYRWNRQDGFQNECKVCTNGRRSDWGKTDAGRAFARRHAKLDGQRLLKREATRRYRVRFINGTDATRARSRVSKAVARGKLPPAKTLACARCGKPAGHYHHHLGYERIHWLDVIPLCHTCHRATHPPRQPRAEAPATATDANS